MKYTVEQIMKWNPCYPIEKVAALIGSGKTSAEIAALGIPAKDRIWCLLRMLCDTHGVIPTSNFAGTCALRATNFATIITAASAASAAADAADAAYAAAEAAADAADAAYAAAEAAASAASAAADAADAAYAAAEAADEAADAAYAAAADAAADSDADSDADSAAYAAERQWQLNYLVAAIGG